MKDSGLLAALQAAGGERQLARLMGVSQQAVNKWRSIPINRVLAAESATGIPREQLRPDFFCRPAVLTCRSTAGEQSGGAV